jgi:hypothetical protein
MDYSGILKKAYHITIKNKILWLLGMMVGGGASCNFGSNADFGQEDIGSNFDFSSIWDYWYILVLIAVLIFFLLLIFIVLSVISRGGLLHGVNKAGENQKVSFKESFKFGVSKFWRVLSLQLLFGLIILSCIIVLSAGIIMCVIIGLNLDFLIIKIILILLGALIALLGFAAIIFFSFIITLIDNYVFCYAVLEDQKVIESMKLGWSLFKKNISDTIILNLILFAIGIGIGLVILMILIPICLVFFAVGYGFYLWLSWVGVVIISAIALLIFLTIIFVIKGIMNVFTFSTWVNAWHELIDKK